jgi:hypothetical protein
VGIERISDTKAKTKPTSLPARDLDSARRDESLKSKGSKHRQISQMSADPTEEINTRGKGLEGYARRTVSICQQLNLARGFMFACAFRIRLFPPQLVFYSRRVTATHTFLSWRRHVRCSTTFPSVHGHIVQTLQESRTPRSSGVEKRS